MRPHSLALLSVLALGLTAPLASAQQMADRIWSGGPILTMTDDTPVAQAIAVADGTILAVGTMDQVMAHQGPDTQMHDLEGRALLPGFVDAHGHVFAIGAQALAANVQAPPDGSVNTIAALQDTLRQWASENAGRVDRIGMIFGFGYDDAQLAEGRHPTRDDLDAVSTDIPVLIIHQSGHLGVVNSKALEILNYTADTENPPGGVIRRLNGSSEPNGVLEETAFFTGLGGLLKDIDPSTGPVVFQAGMDLAASYGYTTAEEGRASPSQVTLMRAVAAQSPLKIDVAAYVDILLDRDMVVETVSPDYDNGFRVAGFKLTIDGSPQGFTALRDRPYYKPPEGQRPDYKGYTAVTVDQVYDSLDFAFANNIQILTHANGEGAMDLHIGALEEATAKHGKADRRPVLIHGQFVREDQVDTYNQLDVFMSLFPMHTFYWGDWHRDRTVGPEKADNISPTGWLVKRGMKFSSHHDAPVAFPDSMRILDATVTRRSRSGDIIGPDQRVDVMTALKAMTIWPAYQHFEEDTKGSLEPGKLADLVILSDDPLAVDPETLDQLKVMETIKDGETIYTRP